MNFKEAEDYLYSLTMFGIKLGLEQERELLDRLGAPDRDLRFIHIAGSNGKGSTSAMLAAALRYAGFKTGFYSSPHLISVRERFRINGVAVSEERLAGLVSETVNAVEEMKQAGRCPTYFELTTALAALYFKQEQTQFVLWETGMGGRFDATNVVVPECSVITGISLEHMEYLGDSIDKVAFEKAGIIKDGVPVFINRMDPVAEAVILRVAEEKNASLRQVPDAWLTADSSFTGWTGQDFRLGSYDIHLELAGRIQVKNAALAVLIMEYLADRFDINMDTLIAGLANARWPGRLQPMPDGTLLDGAHNPEGAAVLVDAVERNCPDSRFTVIYGGFADKDFREVVRILSAIASRFVFVPVKGGTRQCCSPRELCDLTSTIAGIGAEACDDLNHALERTRGEARIICGSLYLAGEALSHFLSDKEITDI
jgi:dihydrofolate synthase/folylpolyglutamate synthase